MLRTTKIHPTSGQEAIAKQWVDGHRFVYNQLVAIFTANPDAIFTQPSLRTNYVHAMSPLVVNNEWLSVNVARRSARILCVAGVLPYHNSYSLLDT